MITDANHKFPAAGEYDLCICGAGPAGLTLALQASAGKRSVLLIEGGDFEYRQRSQEVYRGENVGLDYYPCDVSRLRYFGGTSNHWAGWCRPLDACDFLKREHIAHSGWPISKRDLEPYEGPAREILDLPPPPPSGPDYLSLDAGDATLKKVDFEMSKPTRFAIKYRQSVERSDNLHCVLNANLVDIALKDGSETVDYLKVANYKGETFKARAKYYVLALGGIENPRALLNANRQREKGVGNGQDLVGRFFCEHPHFTVGHFILDPAHPKVRHLIDAGTLERSFYAPTEKFMERRKVLNFGLHFIPYADKLRGEYMSDFKMRIKQAVCRSDWMSGVLREYKEGFSCSQKLFFDGLLRISSEQGPNPDSRVMLSGERDKFGNRRVRLDWRLSTQDKLTLRRAAEEMGAQLARRNIGRLRLVDWLLDPDPTLPNLGEDEVAGFHHMGTTRMADSPARGVVDADCRVFGSENLYIAGSSVFTTGGHSNPTFTIIQLALRLADHLESRLQRRESALAVGHRATPV